MLFAISVTYYYSEVTAGDQRSYLHDLSMLADYFTETPGEIPDFYLNNHFEGKGELIYGENERSLNFEKLVLPIYILSFRSIWVTVTIIALLQTLIMTAVWRQQKVPDYMKLVLLSFFIVPGIAFWSSGLLKESIYLVFILILFAGIFVSGKYLSTLIILFSAIICFSIKPYNSILIFLVSLVLFAIVNEKFSNKVIVAIVVFTVLGLLLLPLIDPNFGFSRWGEIIKENQAYYYANACNGENCIPFDSLYPSLHFKNIIIAFFYGLFGPLDLSTHNNFILLASIQKIILIGITFLCGFLVIREKTNKLLLGCLIIYLFLSSVLTALTTVNFGTLMRYSVFYTPVIWGGFFYFSVKYFRQLRAKRSDFNSFAKKEIK
ncbi:hypothetical protein OO013_01230 [Mangrovivirga sp. M17]|uniref:Dolichyl-phosphate-mannose-protein mannosyltransferase n=1 Tax=Mangrovivirga halotolerans TaxID=2993936 RepID=A0ABT3RM53_9BACT|nr:hypothetical protein [Mangrovivirga halotolerans]MCX2742464.1 hypothetical protein [Mangrovivirga halotolerans]